MSHYFENDKNLASDIKKYTFNDFNITLTFNTDNGVFSKGELDYGTYLLLKNVKDLVSGNILDLGCGYGAISLILKKYIPNSNITSIDVNKRALHLTKMNIKENNLSNIEVVESDGFSNINSKFDYIVTNPPIRVGKTKLYDLITSCKDHLNKDGLIYLVIRKEQGGKSFIKDMSSYFNVDIIEQKKGFMIISLK